jgi:hypothetical protein
MNRRGGVHRPPTLGVFSGGAYGTQSAWGPQRVGRGRLTVSRCARRLPGRLAMAAAQPAVQPLAAYGPGFSVAIDRDVGKGGAGGRVKQLST